MVCWQHKFVSLVHFKVILLLERILLDTYHVAFPKDRLYIKLLVYVVFLLELVQSILIMHDTYVTYVLGFGKFEAVYQTGTYTWFAIPVFSGIGL